MSYSAGLPNDTRDAGIQRTFLAVGEYAEHVSIIF